MYSSEPFERIFALLISCKEGGSVAADVRVVKKTRSSIGM